MYLLLKRILDIIIAFTGLLLMSPLFVILIIVLKFTGEGEVFFWQERIGRFNKPFYIVKFSSMLKNSINHGNKSIALRDDIRITPIGKYLRKIKIDEMPQIFNVLIGDMSLVGARPTIPSSFEKHNQHVKEKIYNTPPGITGIGSIVFRDEIELLNRVKKEGIDPVIYYRKFIYQYKGDLELWYQKNISFSTDFMILIITFWQVIFSHSNLVFKIFGSLPERPASLTLSGLRDRQVLDKIIQSCVIRDLKF